MSYKNSVMEKMLLDKYLLLSSLKPFTKILIKFKQKDWRKVIRKSKRKKINTKTSIT